jgi:hypothetical protein
MLALIKFERAGAAGDLIFKNEMHVVCMHSKGQMSNSRGAVARSRRGDAGTVELLG